MSSLNILDTAPEQAQTEPTPQTTFEPDLFMDGYVSCCLSAGSAEQFFRSLTGTSQTQDPVPVEYDKSTRSFRTMDPQTRGQPVDMLVSYKRVLVIPQAIPPILESKPSFGKTHPIFFLTKGLRDVGVLAQDLVLESCPTLEQPDSEVNLGSRGGHLITISASDLSSP